MSEFISSPGNCIDYFSEVKFKRRVLPFFISNPYQYMDTETNSFNLPHSVTLVTQLSFDRISRINEICQRWQGPLAVAIYLSDAELVQFLHMMSDEFTCLSSSSLDVQLHLVFRHNISFYPINMLRNVAMKYVHTHYVFILDADFIPFGNFKTLPIDLITESHRSAIVIPAFRISSSDE